MSDKQQSAVDWLERELYEKFEVKGDGLLYYEIIDQAKELFKQQIIDAYSDGDVNGIMDGEIRAEQYYNDKFKNESNGK